VTVSGDPHPGGSEEGRPLGRRAFLGIVGVGISSLWWGGRALDLVSQATRIAPESVRSAIPFGQGWRIYSVSPPYPRFDPATWRLRIDGLVAAPQELTYAQLGRLPRAEQVSDFRCVTGWSVDNVHWTGVRFADLLAAARPLPAAKALTFVSAEVPYVDTLTLPQAMASDAMLAYRMDGSPLTRHQRRQRQDDWRLAGAASHQIADADHRQRCAVRPHHCPAQPRRRVPGRPERCQQSGREPGRRVPEFRGAHRRR